MWLRCGCGTNTNAEVVALWGLFSFAIQKEIVGIHVLGDSKVLIDWVNDKVFIRVASLEQWLESIRQLKPSFNNLVFTNVFKKLRGS